MATAPSAREPFAPPAAISVGHVTATDIGLLLIRVIVAAVFIYHGSQKLFGGIPGFADALAGMGVPSPMLSAILSASTEFFGGVAMLLGFGVRIAAIPMVFNMLVAAFMVHGKAFSLQHNGMEYALTLGIVLLGLGFTGPGRLSLSWLLSRKSVQADLDVHR